MHTEQLSPIKITCKDCGASFELSVGEQEWYAEKGFANHVRCKACRDAKSNNTQLENKFKIKDVSELLR
jgi:hypothetical protein